MAGCRTAETRAGLFSNETVRTVFSILSVGLSVAELPFVESSQPISLISLQTSGRQSAWANSLLSP